MNVENSESAHARWLCVICKSEVQVLLDPRPTVDDNLRNAICPSEKCSYQRRPFRRYVPRETLDVKAAAKNTVTPGLRVGRHLSLQERFEEWLATSDGEFVKQWITTKALQMQRSGWKHYGIAAMWEAARFSRDVVVGPNAGFKLNNDFRSRLARLLMAQYEELDGFFETRELKA